MSGVRRKSVIVVIAAVAMSGTMLSGAESVAQSETGEAKSPFRGEIGTVLREEIENAVAEIKVSHEASAEVTAEARRHLEIGDVNKSPVKVRDEFLDFFQSKGRDMVPILAEALIETDVQTRRNAANALGLLTKPKEYQDEEYAELEKKILVPLVIRSLSDEDMEVRASATAMLGGMAFGQLYGFRHNVSPRVVKALAQVMADEENDLVLRIAVTAMVRIGKEDMVPKKLEAMLAEVKTESI